MFPAQSAPTGQTGLIGPLGGPRLVQAAAYSTAQTAGQVAGHTPEELAEWLLVEREMVVAAER